jgi:hypothetical protein
MNSTPQPTETTTIPDDLLERLLEALAYMHANRIGKFAALVTLANLGRELALLEAGRR